MKRIEIRGKIVETPWLRTAEAAAYVGLSRTAFDNRACNVPHGGNTRTRIYHVGILDKWVNGELDGVPFDGAEETDEHRCFRGRRVSVNFSDEELMLIQPRSGKIFIPRNRRQSSATQEGEGSGS